MKREKKASIEARERDDAQKKSATHCASVQEKRHRKECDEEIARVAKMAAVAATAALAVAASQEKARNFIASRNAEQEKLVRDLEASRLLDEQQRAANKLERDKEKGRFDAFINGAHKFCV